MIIFEVVHGCKTKFKLDVPIGTEDNYWSLLIPNIGLESYWSHNYLKIIIIYLIYNTLIRDYS